MSEIFYKGYRIELEFIDDGWYIHITGRDSVVSPTHGYEQQDRAFAEAKHLVDQMIKHPEGYERH